MDFATLGRAIQADTAHEMHVHDGNGTYLYRDMSPDGGPQLVAYETEHPCVVRVRSVESQGYVAERDLIVSAINERRNKLKKGAGLKPQEQRDFLVELIAPAVVGWDNMVWSDNGGDAYLMQWSTENVRKVLKQFPPLRAQIEEAMGDQQAFLERAGIDLPFGPASTPG